MKNNAKALYSILGYLSGIGIFTLIFLHTALNPWFIIAANYFIAGISFKYVYPEYSAS